MTDAQLAFLERCAAKTGAAIGDGVRRAELTADDRVTLRRTASDWLTVRVASDADRKYALALVAVAVEVNRPTAPPGPPPTGADLARRRRFH